MKTSEVASEPVLRERRDLEPVLGAVRTLLGMPPDVELLEAEISHENNGGSPDVLISWSRSNDVAAELLQRGYTNQYRFVVLPSRTRPRWLLPQRPGFASIDGSEIYTPFSLRAKLMKSLLTKIRATGWQGWARHLVLIASKEPVAFDKIAREVTGEKQLAFALSLGTPGEFQKLTIQVMDAQGKILCYAKLPLTNAAGKRLKHEAQILSALQRYPSVRSRVPQLLYGGTWNNGYILIQTMLPGKPGPEQFSPVHDEFLSKLHESNSSTLPGRAVVGEVSRNWSRVSPQAGCRLQNLGADALRIAARELDTARVPCGISHGDFAPWNTRMYLNNLYLFDWESASMNAPRVWDQFHFLAQTESLLAVKHPACTSAGVRFQSRSLYLLYLLHSTAQLLDEHAEERAITYRKLQLSQYVTESSTGAKD
jgi:hypothetical protein